MSKASLASAAGRVVGATAGTRDGVASTMLSGLKRYLARRRSARQVHRLDDFMLKDIGLTRADIFTASQGWCGRRG